MFLNFFLKKDNPRAILFLSGTGTNAEKLLTSPGYGVSWTCSAIVTDRTTSRAKEIAERFQLPLICHDIFQFYRDCGLSGISIATEKGISVRECWTDALRTKIAPYPHDFGLLAGFIPLSNIVGDFPCLNVHPGDLTVEKDGVRIFAGLHYGPVELALSSGYTSLRSSVILARPFTKGAKEMDSGYVLGVSAPVPVRLPEGVSPEQLRQCAACRKNGRNDLLGRIAEEHMTRLKEQGDWTVFPAVVDAFARGHYAFAEGSLCWQDSSGEWSKVRTVEFDRNGTPQPRP